MIIKIFLAAALVSLVACSTTTTTAQPETSQMKQSDLIGSQWQVEAINGEGIIDDSHPTLLFADDGRLSGNASCNRIIGTYKISNNQLIIDQVGTTMMACPLAIEKQERKLLDLLPFIKTYRMNKSGALILGTQNSNSIKARH